MRTCSFCGVTLPEDAVFCASCGQPVPPTTIAGGAPGSGGPAGPAPAQPAATAAWRGAGRQTTFAASPGAPTGADDFGVYALIRRDQSPLAQETLQLLDATRLSVHPRLSAYLGSMLGPIIRYLVLAAVALVAAYFFKVQIPWVIYPLLLVVPVVIVLAKFVEMRTTTITLEGGRLLVSKGVFGRESHNIELYRVLDIALERSLLNRLTGDGTLVLAVEGIHGTRDPYRLPLPGLARIQDLEQLFARLRSLVLLLRTGPWGKGLIS